MRQQFCQNLFVLLALTAGLVLTQSGYQSAQAVTNLESARQALAEQPYVLWQKINQARRDPLAVVARLKLNEAQVRAVFADQGWILDQGLPPLAWNHLLVSTAQAHGRDMIDRVYYAYNSPEGVGYAQRIADAGYVAQQDGELLGALVFDRFVDLEQAVTRMFDIMLRDELLTVDAKQRRIFSAEFTEFGIAYFAETLPLFAGQPYVYLFVADFAQPAVERYFIVGDYTGDVKFMFQSFYTRLWQGVARYPAGVFQASLPDGGGRLVQLSKEGRFLKEILFYDYRPDQNPYVQITAPVE